MCYNELDWEETRSVKYCQLGETLLEKLISAFISLESLDFSLLPE